MTMKTTDVPADRAGLSTNDSGLDVVTGAFSYSGAAIAGLLVERGRAVRTLTGHPERAAGSNLRLDVRPLSFDNPVELARSLEGTTTLYNTYWVRFPYGRTTHDVAVSNSRMLFQAARRAGVERIVHVSITNPSVDSPYPYFAGKARVERALAEASVSYAIVRPAILFGGQGVLLNNIAWLLRHLPAFAIAGNGEYRLRPVHIADLATLCVTLGGERDDTIINAVGPERPTFLELVSSIRDAVGARSRLFKLPPRLVAMSSSMLGGFLRDVLLSNEELHAMMDGLADVSGESTGSTMVSKWIADHASDLGASYLNELQLHFR